MSYQSRGQKLTQARIRQLLSSQSTSGYSSNIGVGGRTRRRIRNRVRGKTKRRRTMGGGTGKTMVVPQVISNRQRAREILGLVNGGAVRARKAIRNVDILRKDGTRRRLIELEKLLEARISRLKLAKKKTRKTRKKVETSTKPIAKIIKEIVKQPPVRLTSIEKKPYQEIISDPVIAKAVAPVLHPSVLPTDPVMKTLETIEPAPISQVEEVPIESLEDIMEMVEEAAPAAEEAAKAPEIKKISDALDTVSEESPKDVEEVVETLAKVNEEAPEEVAAVAEVIEEVAEESPKDIEGLTALIDVVRESSPDDIAIVIEAIETTMKDDPDKVREAIDAITQVAEDYPDSVATVAESIIEDPETALGSGIDEGWLLGQLKKIPSRGKKKLTRGEKLRLYNLRKDIALKEVMGRKYKKNTWIGFLRYTKKIGKRFPSMAERKRVYKGAMQNPKMVNKFRRHA